MLAIGTLAGRHRNSAKKNPAFRRDFPALTWLAFELAILGWILALTARILLLLAGLLTAALLLAGLRVRVLVRHRRSPLLNVVLTNRKARRWLQKDPRFRRDHCVVIAWHNGGHGTESPKLPLYKPSGGAWRCCRTGLPLLENDTTCRSGCRGHRRVVC